MERKSTAVVLAIIISFGFLVRIVGVKWGMPYDYHPDERILIARGIHFLTGDLNPHMFTYPTLHMYLLSLVYLLVYGVGSLLGLFASLQDFMALYRVNPTVFYVSGRILSVLFSVGAVFMVYMLGRKIFNKTVGLLAALLLSITPAYILQTYFVGNDVASSFFVLLSVYYSYDILFSDDKKNYLLAALFGGLAAGEKYNAGLIVVCIIAAHLIRTWEENDGTLRERFVYILQSIFRTPLIPALFLSIAVFLLTSPFLIIDMKSAEWFVNNLLSAHRVGYGIIFVDAGNGHLYHFTHSLYRMAGPFFWLLVNFSIIYYFFHPDKKRLFLLSWIAFYWLFIGFSRVLFSRYVIILVPFFCLISADFMYEILKKRWKAIPALRYAFIVLFVVNLLYMLSYTSVLALQISKQDVRTDAKEWFEKTVHPGTTVGIMISSTGTKHRDDPYLDKTKYKILRDKSINLLLSKSPEYLILSSYDYIDFMRLKDKYDFSSKPYHALLDLFNNKTNYRLVKSFDKAPSLFGDKFLGKAPLHDMMYCFPKILIFKNAE